MADIKLNRRQANLYLNVGDDVELLVQITDMDDVPVDLTGAVIHSHVTSDEAGAVKIAEFDCAVTDGPEGIFSLDMPHAQAAALGEGGWWSVKAVQGGKRKTYLGGQVITTPDNTRIET